MKLTRRKFMEISAAAMAALSLGGIARAMTINGMPYRKLGKTGLKVSILGVGGYHIGTSKNTDNESVELIRYAIDQGVNFLDNAWDYNGGRSEERMGKALQNGYRDKVYLMTKHHGREPETARKHLEDSLRRLKTDMIDVWQFHEIGSFDEAERIYNSGVLDFAMKMRDEGKIRFIGFTGHAHPKIHLKMLEGGFDWDTIQMPINVLDHHNVSFKQNVLPVALEKNIGIIGMKSLAGTPGRINREGIASVEECLRFTLSTPVSTLISGIDTLEIAQENLNIAKNFTPMKQDELEKLLARTLKYEGDHSLEGYKNPSI